MFAKAAARRARALAAGPPAAGTPLKHKEASVETPLKQGQVKRSTKGTPVPGLASTPTPTPGQKHLKVSSSPNPADPKLKLELAYPVESVSTEAPTGPGSTKYMWCDIYCAYMHSCVCIHTCAANTCPRWPGLPAIEFGAFLCGLIGVLGRCQHKLDSISLQADNSNPKTLSPEHRNPKPLNPKP